MKKVILIILLSTIGSFIKIKPMAKVKAPLGKKTLYQDFYQAVLNNKVDEAKELIKEGVNVKASFGSVAVPPLIIAVHENNPEMVQLLLENGANINVRESEGNTPLLMAAQFGFKDIVKKLLQVGADINSKNYFEQTALDLANESGNAEIAKLLVNKSKGINIGNSRKVSTKSVPRR